MSRVRVGGKGYRIMLLLEHHPLHDHVQHDQEADEDDVGEHEVFVLEGCHK